MENCAHKVTAAEILIGMYRDLLDTTRDRWWEIRGLNRCPLSISRSSASISKWMGINGTLFCVENGTLDALSFRPKLAFNQEL